MSTRSVGSCIIAVALLACSGDEAPPAVGTLERDRIELIAESSEPILEHVVQEGARVRAGDLLVRLDDVRFQAHVAEAESRRAGAAARLAELVRGPREERIREARARLDGAQSALLTARRELERAEELIANGVVSPETHDQRRNTHDQARAARDAARAALAELLSGTTVEEIGQAEAALAQADAALVEARVRLDRLSVRAPRDARIDALPYEVGERPPAGGVVAVLLAESAPYARVYVPAVLRAHVLPGTAARVRVDGVERVFEGHVRRISSDAVFTPYFALTERDRGHLAYLAEVDLLEPEAQQLPTGLPLEVEFTPGASDTSDESAEAAESAESAGAAELAADP